MKHYKNWGLESWLKAIPIMAVLLNLMEPAPGTERQITHVAPRPDRSVQASPVPSEPINHELDHNDNFSPDDRFLVFDTRTEEGGIGASRLIAKVEIATGQITPLYQPPEPNSFGPGVGAASYSHCRNEVIFIHGPFHPTGPENQYEQYRRVGVIAAGDGSGTMQQADARDTQAPYLPGALRGGTHRHEFSGDGKWVGFTYNDAVMAAHGRSLGQNLTLRTIGVTRLGHPLSVAEKKQFPNQAAGFSALGVVVVPNPKPGSDEISHAAGDSWVGRHGYPRTGGQRQLARAFIGTTRDDAGHDLDELYVVDIPNDLTQPGPLGTLTGTDLTFPMPPEGTVQRRLTHSDQRRHPGCQGIVRTSHDGKNIAFFMHDDQGDWQVFLISPHGGKPRQATFLKGGVDPEVRWHPSGDSIVTVAGTRIVITNVQPGPQFGKSRILSDRTPAPFALVVSHDGKQLAYNRRLPEGERQVTHIFIDDFPATEPVETAQALSAEGKIVPIVSGAMPNATTYGGKIYFGGQPQEADFKMFARQGIQTVINLCTSTEMEKLAFDELAVVNKAGMKYVHVPIDHEPLTQDGLRTILALLDDAPRNHVLLHCASSNRVGYVWALYRARRHGFSLEAAIQDGKKAGMRAPILTEWLRQALAKSQP